MPWLKSAREEEAPGWQLRDGGVLLWPILRQDTFRSTHSVAYCLEAIGSELDSDFPAVDQIPLPPPPPPPTPVDFLCPPARMVNSITTFTLPFLPRCSAEPSSNALLPPEIAMDQAGVQEALRGENLFQCEILELINRAALMSLPATGLNHHGLNMQIILKSSQLGIGLWDSQRLFCLGLVDCPLSECDGALDRPPTTDVRKMYTWLSVLLPRKWDGEDDVQMSAR